jgi:hypothetical protein
MHPNNNDDFSPNNPNSLNKSNYQGEVPFLIRLISGHQNRIQEQKEQARENDLMLRIAAELDKRGVIYQIEADNEKDYALSGRQEIIINEKKKRTKVVMEAIAALAKDYEEMVLTVKNDPTYSEKVKEILYKEYEEGFLDGIAEIKEVPKRNNISPF